MGRREAVTVAELIGKLSKCPPDAEVFTSDGESGHMRYVGAWLVDAFRGRRLPDMREKVYTDDERWWRREHEPNCRAVVISHFSEDGEEL